MGYLLLTRKEDEMTHLSTAPYVDPAEVLDQLRAGHYIDVAQIKGSQVNTGIEAPASEQVLRGELLEEKVN